MGREDYREDDPSAGGARSGMGKPLEEFSGCKLSTALDFAVIFSCAAVHSAE